MYATVLHYLDLISRIIFLILVPLLGLFLLIAGRLKVGVYSVKGWFVRLIGVVFVLDAAIFYFLGQRGFLHKNSILIQALLLLAGLLVLWILAEKPARHQPLPAETHTFKSGPEDLAYRS